VWIHQGDFVIELRNAAEVTPSLSAADAVAAMWRKGLKRKTRAKDPSDVRLGLFTSMQMGKRTLTGFVPSFRDRLAWIIRYCRIRQSRTVRHAKVWAAYCNDAHPPVPVTGVAHVVGSSTVTAGASRGGESR
jgi:hypothetical protein